MSIGAKGVIDGATIEPGAIVSPLARVGPGVTVPAGLHGPSRGQRHEQRRGLEPQAGDGCASHFEPRSRRSSR